MKVTEILSAVLNGAELENKAALMEAMNKVPDVDLGEHFDTIRPALGRMIDKNLAHQFPEVVQKVRTSVEHEFENKTVMELTAAGFTQEEIAEFQKDSQKIKKAFEKFDEKARQKYQITATEREKLLENQISDYRKKLDDSALTYKMQIEQIKREQQLEQHNKSLKDLVMQYPQRDDIKDHHRFDMINGELRIELDRVGGELHFIGNQVVVRQKGNPALSVQEGNTLLTTETLIRKAIANANLSPAQKPGPQNKPIPGPGPSPLPPQPPISGQQDPVSLKNAAIKNHNMRAMQWALRI